MEQKQHAPTAAVTDLRLWVRQLVGVRRCVSNRARCDLSLKHSPRCRILGMWGREGEVATASSAGAPGRRGGVGGS
eukprot:3758297-Rhodomonas_salina.2